MNNIFLNLHWTIDLKGMIWTNQRYDSKNQKLSVFLILYLGQSSEMPFGGQSVSNQPWGMGLSSVDCCILVDICIKSYCKLKEHLLVHKIGHLSKWEIRPITKSGKRGYFEKWITFRKEFNLTCYILCFSN